MASNTPLVTIQDVFRSHRWSILLTYALTMIENLFELLYPLLIGIAIDGLLGGVYINLLPFVVIWSAHTITLVARQRYDTRTFTNIYSKLATTIVLEQGKSGVPTSQIVARSALSREFVDFFERDIPLTITAAFSFIGAIVMLFFYDWQIGAYALAMILPVWLINRRYGRTSLRLNKGLNDQIEREVDILTEQQPDIVRTHYRLLAQWQVRLSDAEATNWGITTVLLGVLVVAVLIRAIGLPNVQTGDIYAIVTYVFNFTFSFDDVPFLIQQIARLRDIGNRVNLPEAISEVEEDDRA